MLTSSFTAVPGFQGPGPLKMTVIIDVSSGAKAFLSSATGIKFRGRSFSESMGDGGEPTGASLSTGVTGEVRGREYGLGRDSSVDPDWSAWSTKVDSHAWAGVTWSKAAWSRVSWVSTDEGAGEGGDKRPWSMVIGRMYVRGNSGGKVEGSRAVSSLAGFLATGGGHTICGAAKAPRGANSCLIKAPLPVFSS